MSVTCINESRFWDDDSVLVKEEARKNKSRSFPKLGLSASEQPTPQRIRGLIEENPRILIVDLREESHFFFQDYSVSKVNAANDVNRNKLHQEIQGCEQELVDTIREIGSMNLHMQKKEKMVRNGVEQKMLRFTFHDTVIPEPEDLYTEEELIETLKGTYERLPITDHGFPDDMQIDRLITLYETYASIHFHCAGGKGRSSLAVALLAILKQAKEKELDEIFAELEKNGNKSLLKDKPGTPKKSRSNLIFWQTFHQFARVRESEMTWSEWKKQNKALF